jgi:nucleotide-binding universal stress UspA family protein
MYNQIVVPLDGSAMAEAALSHAVEIARKFGSNLLLVRVVSATGAGGFLSSASILGDPSMGGVSAAEAELLAEAHDEELAEAQGYINGLIKKLSEPEVQVCGEVMEGSPAEAIMHFAHKVKANLIVLTTHGRTGLMRMVMGSVADQIVRQCGCPVLLIRNG